ncbi:hypothetical protein ACHAXR_004419 [Thalassiosira sp. AJA248-18]
MATTGSNKRRRTALDSINISDLPDSIFGDVAAYLPKPSMALFAVAMTAPSPSWSKFNWQRQPSATSKVILSSASQTSKVPMGVIGEEQNTERWVTLNFADISKNLALRLTDEDVGAILVCINAKKSLKTLKLAGCINIEGHGLEPLRSSTVLEQIDLGLVGQHESPLIEPEPRLSEETVVTILNTIISADSNSLKHIQFPKKWRDVMYIGPGPMLGRFIERYNELLENRSISCAKCDRSLGESAGREWIHGDHNAPWYGMQNYTCCQCTKYFCYSCQAEGGDFLCWCLKCEKDYCSDCVPMVECTGCGNDACKACEAHGICGECGEECCSRCLNECISCNKAHCFGCSDGKDNDVGHCEICSVDHCLGCLYSKCSQDWDSACSGCVKLLAQGVAPLRQEVEELKERVKQIG